MEQNVKQLLENIKELNQQKINVLVPSTNKQHEFSLISFKQQKEIITIIDGAIGALKFQKILNDIIMQNSSSDEFLMTDKFPIILKLRVESIGNTLTVDGDTIDLNDIITRIEKFNYPKLEPIETNNLKIELSIPTLREENKIIQESINNVKKDLFDEDISKNISELYTYEIVKFIDSISFGEYKIQFRELSIFDRYKIVENLPLDINNKIISNIQKIKQAEIDFLTVRVGEKDKVIEIDVSFFVS